MEEEELRTIYGQTKSVRRTTEIYNAKRSKKKRVSREAVRAVVEKAKHNGARKSFPRGVVLFCVLIVFSSLVHMRTLITEKEWYFDIYKDMPLWLAQCRYGFSWFQRIVGLTCAGLVFSRVRWGRLLVYVIGVFTIVTVPWKHPYQAFLEHTQRLNEQLGPMMQKFGASPTIFSDVAVYSMNIHRLLDILFWVIFMRYFARPYVKDIFK